MDYVFFILIHFAHQAAPKKLSAISGPRGDDSKYCLKVKLLSFDGSLNQYNIISHHLFVITNPIFLWEFKTLHNYIETF